MAARRAHRRDLVATLWVALAIGFYVVSLAVTVPGFGSPRAVAGILLVLGSFACGAGADTAAFTEHGVTTPAVAALRVGGVVLLVIGVTAVITGWTAALAALAAGIGVMWLVTTTRHLLAPAAPAPNVSAPRERVHSGVGH